MLLSTTNASALVLHRSVIHPCKASAQDSSDRISRVENSSPVIRACNHMLIKEKVTLMLKNGAYCCHGGQAGEHTWSAAVAQPVNPAAAIYRCRIRLRVVKGVSRTSYVES